MTQSEAIVADKEALKSRVLPQMAFNKVKATPIPKPTKEVPNSQTADMAKLRFKVVGNAMYLNSLLSYNLFLKLIFQKSHRRSRYTRTSRSASPSRAWTDWINDF